MDISAHFSLFLRALSSFRANLLASFSVSVFALFRYFLEDTGPSLPASGAALLQLAALAVGAVRSPAGALGGPNEDSSDIMN